MRSQSQMKVSTISFLIALIVSLVVFGLIAFFIISNVLSSEKDPNIVKNNDKIVDNKGDEPVLLDPEEIEKINGKSFSVLIAGYDVKNEGFDAMLALVVDKENQKVSVYPINTDTKVYVGSGDTNTLDVRLGDLIKYKDEQYVLDKVSAATGVKFEYYVTFTAEGFIEAFDAFNKNGDYVYKVPKDMNHVYVEIPEPQPDENGNLPEVDPELKELEKYNIEFKKGDTLKNGIDIYNMLRYKGDSSSDRMNRQATFARDVIAKIVPSRFKEGNLSAVLDTANALAKLTSSIKTNIGIDTFITETFDLIAAIPNFSVGTVTKYTSGIANFK